MVAARKRTAHLSNGHAGRGLQSRLKTLRGDVGALQDDVAGLLGDVGDIAGEQMQEAMHSARRTAGRVETWGNDNLRDLRKRVEDDPIRACAIAAAIGALVGLFLFRR